LGYINGDLRFWLGWAQQVAGDHAAAQESWRQARRELESFLKEQPENFYPRWHSRTDQYGLGDKAAALVLAERAMAAMPVEQDAPNWSYSDRDPRPGGGPSRTTRPRHRRFTETTLDTVLWPGWRRAAHSCAAPARPDVRSATERSAFQSAD